MNREVWQLPPVNSKWHPSRWIHVTCRFQHCFQVATDGPPFILTQVFPWHPPHKPAILTQVISAPKKKPLFPHACMVPCTHPSFLEEKNHRNHHVHPIWFYQLCQGVGLYWSHFQLTLHWEILMESPPKTQILFVTITTGRVQLRHRLRNRHHPWRAQTTYPTSQGEGCILT